MKENAKVLIVDDEEQVLELLSAIIKNNGLSVATAKTAEQALSKIRTSDNIKLVLLDIYLPDNKDSKLLQQILKINPNLKVIMITGGSDIELAKKCLELGAADYITKPFDIQYLETSVLAEIIPEL